MNLSGLTICTYFARAPRRVGVRQEFSTYKLPRLVRFPIVRRVAMWYNIGFVRPETGVRVLHFFFIVLLILLSLWHFGTTFCCVAPPQTAVITVGVEASGGAMFLVRRS